MKIGVISDTHIPISATDIPDVVLEAFKDVDMILHAGDLVNLSVIDILKSVCPNVTAVSGNMDSAQVKQVLSKKEVINIGKHKIGLTHGCGAPATLVNTVTHIFEADGVDVIVFGHSHAPLCETIGNVLYFNPGSLTDKIFTSVNSYGIIEINEGIEGKIFTL